MFSFDNTFSNQLEGLYISWKPEGFPEPRLVLLNRELAAELNLQADELEKTAALLLSGNVIPEGAAPLAQAYAGHQFGGFSPQLGDGRALLLGEVVDRAGHRRDIQLKGSGPTPFSRGGDGRATLGSVLREYLVSEAMYRLGVPTTRALAAVTTGELVYRERGFPGAVLTRIAASHLRVGTFEFLAARNEFEKLRRLTAYALARHFPDVDASVDDAPNALLRQVASVQGQLIAAWMLIGFVHGVMNTDNTTISGETIDYGPCAFMEAYDPNTVFSSIDHHGRYAYGNQPSIGAWNLMRLGVALSPLMAGRPGSGKEAIEKAVSFFMKTYESQWLAGMRCKLGLQSKQDSDLGLVESLLEIMSASKLDYTSLFRDLSASLRRDRASSEVKVASVPGLEEWVARWRERLALDGEELDMVAQSMDQVNPLYIPRNHLVEAALEEAAEGDLTSFEKLRDVLSHPYDERAEWCSYSKSAPPDFGPYKTFCGT